MTDKTFEYLKLAVPLQNSIEIKETAKGVPYLGSIKLYFSGDERDAKGAMKQLFAMYDEARKQINERSK